ncbi:hypothetical protein OG205_37695 [Lentzea sp. NBC_00516]|uniref:hypothetical protein n=1 Tax=Lentzea sp. NBC_00516 TaxID=2903582 RepID=UPI002E80C453|nr:hypothetical protein [Lentzea sp. NBC_00516]WUD23732.1 hypothetical protein OG205_37695 [Lentzea sp. NBC_00516]
MLIAGPDTRVVELRVHGVQGTTPQTLVDAVAAVDVAGDGLGRIVRPADRLRRPAPGPVLQTEGRPIPRVVEGYLWGGMTSGGVAKATWALLFPFSIANVAHWMLPPVPERNLPAHLLGIGLRSLLRVFALLLTALLVAQISVVSLDLLAAQCLRPGTACLTSIPADVRMFPWFRTFLGILPIIVVIAVIRRVSHVEWRIERKAIADAEEQKKQPASGLPGAHVATDPDTPALRSLHVVTALAVTALIALGGPLKQLTATGGMGVAITVAWTVSLALIGVSVLGVLLLDDPTGGAPHRGGRWLRAALGRKPRRLLLVFSVLLVLTTLGLQEQLPLRVPGADVTVQVVALLMAFVLVLFGLMLIPAALLARGTWKSLPRELRPWAGGWFSAPVLAIGGLLGGGFGAGVALPVRKALGDGLRLPAGYEYITLLWGVAGALALLSTFAVASFTGAVRWRAFRKGKVWAREASLLHSGRMRDLRTATRAWWWARWERNHGHHMILIIASVLVVGAVLATVLRVQNVPLGSWAVFSAFGVFVLGLLAVSLLRAVYLAARQPESGRRLGIIADIAQFWPREAHPIVPPCYALKVVPELVARVQDHLRDPGTRVVLCGHSQGSLLVAVAAARLLEELPAHDRERIGLLTAGSQLQWAYPRAFPAVVPHASLARLAGGLDGRWRALCRGTDPLGGAVTTWRRQVFDGMLLGVGYREDGSEGALAPALRGPTGALVLGGDHWLPDPQRGPFPGRRWRSGVSAHSDYTSDPEWDRAVAIAAGLLRVDAPESPSLPFARKPETRSRDVLGGS